MEEVRDASEFWVKAAERGSLTTVKVDGNTDEVGLRGNQEFVFKHGTFEISFRHPCRHCLSAGGCVDLEFRREVQREINILELKTHSGVYVEIR